jgi:aminoglycoside 3-N-acetyltransferase
MSDRLRELLLCYRDLGVGPGRVVHIAADFGRMLTDPKEAKLAVLNDHLTALRELLGPEGTIVVPTATLNLCNTDTVFDPETTPSHQMGAFSEFVRQLPGARRSFHPFWSHTALGARAADVVDNVSRHGQGMGSVWSRLIEADALSIHIGKHPSRTVSVVHHIELVVGVPYRYTKEFMHPVKRGASVCVEPFYHFVWYRDCDLVRDKNRRIFDNFATPAGRVRERPQARGAIWSFSFAEFYEITRRFMSHDLYAWLEREPLTRPYRC